MSEKISEFLVRKRTKLSQLLGVVFVFVFLFSEKRLETVAHSVTDIMIIAGCVMVGIATVGRIWCAQYIAGYKTNTLIKEGPYSVCRNPLYFFSFLGSLGVGFFTESIVLTAVIVIVFALIYPMTIKNEERALRAAFGEEYERYCAEVPRFLPKPSLFNEPKEYLVNTKIFRREVFDATGFALLAATFEFMELLLETGLVKPLFTIY